MTDLGPLADGGRVVVVGGGPAGVACALALHKRAADIGRKISISVLESKDFAGERHHNLSVGVLSPPLCALMEEGMGVHFPWHLAKADIGGYVLHSPHYQVWLEDHGRHGVALRRVQFDAHMLDQARRSGIDVLSVRAVDLDFHHDGVVVYTDREPLPADVVVGAFGLDEGAGSLFGRVIGYRPPKALTSILTKYHPGPEAMARFGDDIHAFLPGYYGIEFGAITPKGDHLTVNIAGTRVDASSLRLFLERPEVKAALPCFDSGGSWDPDDLRFFKGRFPNSLAGNYYGDRYVMIGDAAGLVRAFKGKGVTSAVQTAVRAAHTILETGISGRAFANDFAVANRDITDDLAYGRVMRLLVAWSVRLGLLDPVVRAAQGNAQVRAALFGAVSAHAPYRDVLLGMLEPHAVYAVLAAMIGRQPT